MFTTHATMSLYEIKFENEPRTNRCSQHKLNGFRSNARIMLKTGFCLILSVVCITTSALAGGQTLNKIKSASDNHSSSRKSSNSSSSSNSRTSSSSNSYYESNDTYYDDSYDDDNGVNTDAIENRPLNRDQPDTDENEKSEVEYCIKPKVKKHDLIIRQAVDNRKVMMTTVQFNRSSNHFFTSIRSNQMRELRADEVDKYNTFEFQFLGYHTMTSPLSFSMATGGFLEVYSGNIYLEHLAILQYAATPGLTFYAEGRYAGNNGSTVRTEGTLTSMMTVKSWDSGSVNVGIFFTSALYYQKVPVENLGVNASLRF